MGTELAPFLGWKTAQAVGKEIRKRKKEAESLAEDVEGITGRDPRLIVEIVKGLTLDAIPDDQIPKIGEAIGDLAPILIRVDETQRNAISRIVKQLPLRARRRSLSWPSSWTS